MKILFKYSLIQFNDINKIKRKEERKERKREREKNGYI